MIALGGTNIYDGLLGTKLVGSTKGPALIGIDTKHTSLVSKNTVPKLLKKRQLLEDNLPQFNHLLIIASNKRAQQRSDLPHTAESLKLDNKTCVISNTDDCLFWALSPTISPLVIEVTEKEITL